MNLWNTIPASSTLNNSVNDFFDLVDIKNIKVASCNIKRVEVSGIDFMKIPIIFKAGD